MPFLVSRLPLQHENGGIERENSSTALESTLDLPFNVFLFKFVVISLEGFSPGAYRLIAHPLFEVNITEMIVHHTRQP